MTETTSCRSLALELLRLHRGEDVQTFWEKDRLPTLNGIAKELRSHHLTSQEVIGILENVADLRNSIAHKQLLYGMTTYAQYDNKSVFDSHYLEKFLGQPGVHVSGVNEEILEQLLEDVHHACTALKQAATLISRCSH